MAAPSPIRQLASDAAVYGLSTLLARSVNYLLVPFYTNVFEPSDYGVISVVYAALVFGNILFTYGMESSYLRHAAAADACRAQLVFSTAFWSLLLSALGLSLALVSLAAPVAQLLGLGMRHRDLVYWMALVLFLDTVAVVPMASLRLKRRAWLYAGLRTGNVLLNVLLNLGLILALGWGVEAVLASNAAASLALAAFSLILERGQLRCVFDRGLWRAMLGFGLPFVPTGLGYAISESVDRLFLVRMPQEAAARLYGADTTPVEVAGIYGACYKLGVFMLLYVQMFRLAWQPFFLERGRDPKAPTLFARIFTLFTALGALLFLAVSFFVRDLVRIGLPIGGRMRYVVDPAYWEGLFIVPLILLAYLAQGWYVYASAGVFLRNRTRDLPWITLGGALLTLAGNAWGVPRYGMAASAWTTLLSYLAMAVALLARAQRYYPIPFAWRDLGGICLITALAYALFLWLDPALGGRILLLLFAIGSFIAFGWLPGRKGSGWGAS
ncbi:MAG: oligosaccharide flippase family protein [Bacteroidota bacterium]|nr:oligosaccharide flippase family protein [Bacteroidota bacterium]MDW8138454.1 oligosaccharide flippase family protein [Bacteroidota bacterium]